VSCDPERVTGYVDGELAPDERAQLETHLPTCAACSAQVAEERSLRARLRSLPQPEPRPALEARLRQGLAPRGRSRLAAWLALAAVLLAGLAWSRGSATLVGVQLARDHRHCFSAHTLPAQIWSNQVDVLRAFFEKRGTRLPPLPSGAAGLELVGARFCGLLDRPIAHLYYSAESKRLSLFVVPEPVRLDGPYTLRALGQHVRLRRVAGQAVGLVADNEEDLAAFERSFDHSLALFGGPEVPPAR